MAATATADDDEWQICNDDGFVYKRRRRDDSDDPQPLPPVDSASELRRHHRARRRQCLSNLRDKYNLELQQWETLAAAIHQLAEPLPAPSPPTAAPPLSSRPDLVRARRKLVDDLLAEAEAQEALLQKATHLCDCVEAECKVRGERMAEALLDLPVWRSPRSLMNSLSDPAAS